MKSALSTVVVVALIAAGCVRQDRFRYVRQQPSCFGGSTATDPVPGVPKEARDWPSLDCRHRDYDVGFIEFDKNGKAIDPTQADKVLELIKFKKSAAPAKKIITLVYVHGWKNNADQKPPGANAQDVERFESALSELAYRSQLAKPASGSAVPVVGVYIGWPGKSLMGPGWFTFASFWDRRNTANHVGDGEALAETLNRVIDETNRDSSASRVMLVGHSFGARVLEHTIASGRVKLFDEAQTGSVAPRVDLTLYVNSANDARLSLSTVNQLRSTRRTVRHPDYRPEDCTGATSVVKPTCREYPLLVAITSRGDLATKYLLPTANTLYGFGDGIKKELQPTLPPDAFADRRPSSGTFRRSAAGHLAFMHSHVVREISCPSSRPIDLRAAPPACKADNPSCQFAFQTVAAQRACYEVDSRQPTRTGAEAGAAPATTPKPPFNTTAFWIMAVDPAVIKDHGDIWNQSFIQMLGELMSPRGFFNPTAGRMTLR